MGIFIPLGSLLQIMAKLSSTKTRGGGSSFPLCDCCTHRGAFHAGLGALAWLYPHLGSAEEGDGKIIYVSC